MSISELVLSLEAIDPSLLDRDGVNAALCSVARIHSWLEVKQAHLVRRLKALAEASACVVPEADIAAATRTSRGDAERMSKRADALGALPEIESALSTGQLSASHVDALARTMRDLTPEQRTLFAAQGAQHATIAQRSTPEQFARYLRREAQRFSKRAGEDRLIQQRKNSGVRWWLDSDTGMWVLRAELDPRDRADHAGSARERCRHSVSIRHPRHLPIGSRSTGASSWARVRSTHQPRAALRYRLWSRRASYRPARPAVRGVHRHRPRNAAAWPARTLTHRQRQRRRSSCRVVPPHGLFSGAHPSGAQ